MPITLIEGESRRLDTQLTPLPPQPATLWGSVIDAETGSGISGATVTLVGAGLADVTDSSGSFEITNTPPGTYSVRVSHPDYETVVI